jgi:hypothetical protein
MYSNLQTRSLPFCALHWPCFSWITYNNLLFQSVPRHANVSFVLFTYLYTTSKNLSVTVSTRSTFVGFEVLTVWVLRVLISWDMTPWGLVKANRPVGEICRIHLRGQRISQARSQCETLFATLFSGFDPDDGGHVWLRNFGWLLTE